MNHRIDGGFFIENVPHADRPSPKTFSAAHLPRLLMAQNEAIPYISLHCLGILCHRKQVRNPSIFCNLLHLPIAWLALNVVQ